MDRTELPNKAQRWVHEAIEEVAKELPFPLLGLDSDNGAEFINMQLYTYCCEHGITFTRSRPYRKNDNCYVEQKNWPVVRQQVGYAGYDTAPGTAGVEGAVPGAPPVRELLPAPDEARRQDPSRSKLIKRFDIARTPYPTGPGLPPRRVGGQEGAPGHLPRAQPRPAQAGPLRMSGSAAPAR